MFAGAGWRDGMKNRWRDAGFEKSVLDPLQLFHEQGASAL